MLRAAPTAAALAFLVGGCLWEPIEETPPPGNSDVAPVIKAANPSNHEIAVNSGRAENCTLEAGLPTVFSPRAAALSARFFLNYGDTTAARASDGGLEPLALSGEIEFQLQVSQGDPTIYSLPPKAIALVDFLGQLNSPTNVLWVFVSDDFKQCPDPSSVVPTPQTSPSNTQTLECFTTSWSWVIDVSGCDFLTAP